MNGDDDEKSSGWFDLSSNFWRTILVVIAALLIFVGPTYLVYLLSHHFKVNYVASAVLGVALFLIGLALIGYLARKKVLT